MLIENTPEIIRVSQGCNNLSEIVQAINSAPNVSDPIKKVMSQFKNPKFGTQATQEHSLGMDIMSFILALKLCKFSRISNEQTAIKNFKDWVTATKPDKVRKEPSIKIAPDDKLVAHSL